MTLWLITAWNKCCGGPALVSGYVVGRRWEKTLEDLLCEFCSVDQLNAQTSHLRAVIFLVCIVEVGLGFHPSFCGIRAFINTIYFPQLLLFINVSGIPCPFTGRTRVIRTKSSSQACRTHAHSTHAFTCVIFANHSVMEVHWFYTPKVIKLWWRWTWLTPALEPQRD